MYQTIAAIATPPGQGGIAVIRISGENAYAVASKVFIPINNNKSISNAKGYTALFGKFIYEGNIIDEGIALCFRAPHSYTGEDVIELSCHGGSAVSEELLVACIQAGASPAISGEFTKRAVLNGRINLTQAEAVMDIISATSQQAAAAAQAALSGALYKVIQEQKDKLLALAGHLTAYIDYPDEGVEELEKETFKNTLNEVYLVLSELVKDYSKNTLLKRGVQTAIVGSPNVGKSTLFNLISGAERAIVTSIAGTTRDVVRETIQIGGIPLNISDTAGLRKTDDLVEIEGIKRSYSELEQAAFIIAVFDGTQKLTENDWKLIEKCKNRVSLALINKSDLGVSFNKTEIEEYFTEVLVISAKDVNAKKSIEMSVKRILNIDDITTNTAMLANERQLAAAVAAKEAVGDAKNALENGVTYDAAGICLDDALLSMAELVGENVSEIVLDNVFSNFCVGK